MSTKKLYGLIGFPLTHSFSEKYFSEKFEKENIKDSTYKLFPIQDLDELPDLIKSHPELMGLNVTIPYKIKIIPFLTKLDDKASEIEAVNVIKKTPEGDWIGFNSDYYGFLSTLSLFGDAQFWANRSALVFGTGGSAKAIQAVLRDLNISWKSISRNQTENSILYTELDDSEIQNSTLMINCTPLGMFPDVESSVPINYKMLNEQHVVIDLVYNPPQTKFLRLAGEHGAKTQNGLHMLVSQAEKAWEIWNS